MFSHQRGDSPADGQIDPLNESGLNELCKAIQLQEKIEVFAFAPEHAHDSKPRFSTFALLDKLTVQQVIRYLPMIGSSVLWAKPMTEMRRNGVEVAAESVGGESGDAVGLQTHF